MKYLNKKEAQPIITKTVNDLVDAIKSTYGPASNKVLISKSTHKMVVDDGVQICRDFKTNDDAENAVLDVIREVAIRTNDRVGDGTTSSMIMLRAIINEIATSEKTSKEIESELLKGIEEAKAQLREMKKDIETEEDLKKVAKIAFDNDEIATLIAKLLFEVGKDGVITIEKSNTFETESERVDGMEIKRGYIADFMKNTEWGVSLEEPYIILTDYRITSFSDILPIMEKLTKEKISDFIIFCEHIEGDALSLLFQNKMAGGMRGIAISLSDDRKEILDDLALITGGTVLNTESGKTAKTIEVSDLGRADRITITKDRTIIKGVWGDKEKIDGIANVIKKNISECPLHEKPRFERKLARLTNGIAIIKVGAPTENEVKALQYKVDDAVNATKVAFNSGVVPGAGLALAKIKTSSDILNKALKEPNKQLIENSGEIEGTKKESDKVIDPCEVLCSGLDSAVSISNLLTSISGLLIETPIEDEDRKNGLSNTSQN